MNTKDKATATAEENQFLRAEVWRLGSQCEALLEACKEAMTCFQLLGSGQRPSVSNSEMVELLSKAIQATETK